MPTVSLTDFSSQQAEIDRRRKMAELLQQQAAQPIEIQSYKGIQAPIPWTAMLGDVLTRYAASSMERKANKDEADAKRKAREEAAGFLSEQQVDPGLSVNAGMIKPEDLSTKMSFADQMKYGGGSSPQALGAVLGGQPAPQPQAPPMPPQAQPAPMPGPVQQAPLPPAGPPQAVSPMAPLSQADVAPSQADDPRRARPMAEQQARLLEASMSGNPYLEKLAPALYQRNQTREDEDRKFDQTVAYDGLKRQLDFRDKALLQSMKPEARPAALQEYEYAKSQGFQGSLVDFKNATAPPVVVGYGADVYRRGDLNGAPGSAPSVQPGQLDKFVSDNFPGAVVTSGQRTPGQNAAVGGVPNSAHLSGNARDFVYQTPQGIPDLARMQAEADRFNQNAPPGVKLMYEGPGAKNSTAPHLHLELAGTAQGPAQPVARGRDKPESTGAAFGAWAMTPEEQTALNQAVGQGRVDLKGLNSRTAKITAAALLANPGLNAMQLHAVAQVSANPAFQQRAKALEALPESLALVNEAGKKIDFSKYKAVGNVQAFIKDQTNNPDFRAYMAKRNDAMQRLGFAMRGVGMSDQSVKLELESAPVAMDPAAFDAWYKAQVEMVGKSLNSLAVFQVAGAQTPGAGNPPPQAAGAPYADPGKEARYQAWRRAHGGQ